MVVAGTLNEPGTVTISGVPATVDANNNFRGTVPTTSGTNTFTIVAKDASGNTTTQQYEVELSRDRRRRSPTTRMAISPPTARAHSSGMRAINSSRSTSGPTDPSSVTTASSAACELVEKENGVRPVRHEGPVVLTTRSARNARRMA